MSSSLLMAQHEFAQQTVVENGLLKSLTEGLHTALSWDAPEEELGRKLSTVRFIFQSFQRHLERLMSLEEVDGYMDSVLATNPHLSKPVEALREEHADFRFRSAEIAQQLERLTDRDSQEFEQICREITDLLMRLEDHTDDEAKLFLEAFGQEDGGEG